MVDLDAVIEQAAVLRPGDRLVLRLNSSLTPADLDFARLALAERLPDIEAVFLGGGIEDMVVYRAGEVAP